MAGTALNEVPCFDCIIIGAGAGGMALAEASARAGRKTALIEYTSLGGCSVNNGGLPTKTMIASGRVAHLTCRGADYGIHTPGGTDGSISADMPIIQQNIDHIVETSWHVAETRLCRAGVKIYKAHASFEKDRKLTILFDEGPELRTRPALRISGDLIFICTGSSPDLQPAAFRHLAKLYHTKILDSRSILKMEGVPQSLLIVGGGFVGVEFAQLFHRLGSAVVIIEQGGQLLPNEDTDVAEVLQDILRKDRIEIYLKTSVTQTFHDSQTPWIEVTLSDDRRRFQLQVTHVLLATGRIPNTRLLNLEAVGVNKDDQGYIITNNYLQTSSPGIYALGDVKGPPAFTHVSYDDVRIINANILNRDFKSPMLSIEDRVVPYVIYTDPQLGHIGLHEHEARQRFRDDEIRIAVMSMIEVPRARATNEFEGIMKAIVHRATGKILGFTCLGLEGGEIMSIVQVAMVAGLSYEKLQQTMFASTSIAEGLNNLWSYFKEPVL